ncbi:spermidine/putrescine ABC transporter substrate-binding protein [Streptomyces sp. NBC_00006]|uniref:polyamine ABC transporter substrate-binding protein n=1 Tax=Streptomyces sp. NBC_00006 TaxID=2975619 RepID=UPI002259767C|nr:spermidine/putrescine ABC transporter substrate-binding protein [Streptomyces sp. NBC_00006]MCX5529807.1 spermidine/putrescine ABC transporter substrate-binding protein [Streptomyces sp. NBC_00006]
MPEHSTPFAPRPRGPLPRGCTRRGLLRAAFGAAALAPLAACSVPGARVHVPTGKAEIAAAVRDFWSGKKKTGKLDFVNYTQYIDVAPGDQSKHPTLDAFTRESGTKVAYHELIDDSASWFGKIQPEFASGQGIGYDLMVVGGDSYLTKYIELGYLAPLDHSRLPTFARHGGAVFKNSSFDPGNVYTVPWQSGMTGIGYDPARVGRKITSWQDLLDPKLRGKVGMWNDAVQMGNIALLAVGVNPETSTHADWRKAAAWLRGQRDAGMVRSYSTATYQSSLQRGDLAASLVYSGDVFQANQSGSELEFVIPDEGGLLWTDNLCIPSTATHAVDALAYMDYVYRPEVAAKISETVQFVCPVPGAQKVVAQDAAAATGKRHRVLDAMSTSPLVFPTKADQSKLRRLRVLDKEEEKQWNALFEPIYQA